MLNHGNYGIYDPGSAVPPPPPPSPPPPMVGSPSNLLFCTVPLHPPPPPPLWCGVVWLCPRCLALFPSPVWGGVVWLCPRPGPYCSSSGISGIIIIIIIIIHGWYPHKPAVLRGSVTPSPVVWCGCPPPCGAASTAAATSIPSGT